MAPHRFQTRVTELLGICYPIFQGGMAWISEEHLVSAVSEAGGLGILSAGNLSADQVKEKILRVRQKTDRPFGVNLVMMSPHLDQLAQLMIDQRVPVVTTGAGNPGKYISRWKQVGICVIPVISSVAMAKRMERAGADALIAEGCEAGGHIGKITTMALIPQVSDQVSIPVIGAGGIADGRGAAAAFLLGAEGIQMGTRFLASEECQIHPRYKEKICSANDTNTVVIGREHPVRQLKSKAANWLQQAEQEGDLEAFERIASGSLRAAVLDGDLEQGSFMAGQSAGLIHSVQPVQTIIEQVFQQMGQEMARWNG